MKRALLPFLVFTVAITFFSTSELVAQRRGGAQTFNEKYYNSLQWRCIGPFRGGRSAAVTGVPGKPMLFYMGATGGGVWRTKDGGSTWENISDGYFGGSIGAIAVSESDNNVMYVGGGEVTVRGNVSYGYGMYKTVDAGQTWKHIGLKNSRHIPRVRIHPDNPDLVYAAVLGDLFKSSEERGVYRSKDGGETWERVLFANADAGAVDLVMDPTNPRILYASTWRVRRTPYSLSSGGEGSALWKSTDGGDTWSKISDNDGFPDGTLGIIGIAVSPVNGQRVWAIAEAANGGVFRSENGGKTWSKTNDDRALRQRAWYYSRIYADTKDENTVYVMNVAYHKSTDGGKTFRGANAPHGDHHDLWIAPEDPSRMVIADDGGAQVTYDGGINWSTYKNQPTSQFYRVTTDDHFPYRIYGAQQDNSAIRIAHRKDGWGGIGEQDWESTAGGESAHLAPDPTDNDVVYGGSYGGFLTRLDHKTRQSRAINVWPDNPMGHGAEGMKYRFQWNFPVFFSPHDPQKLYTASNHLHLSTDGGGSWKVISPDLTRNDSTKLGPSGGPITKDNTGVEYYATIFAAAESPYEKNLLWAGSDDGLIHISKDAGANWTNVTPKNMPEWMMINSIEIDPFNKGGLYVAGTLYKTGDYRPYLYHTTDYGKTWSKITNGIDEGHFTRVVRADPKRQGLLYAGTESGMYISFDDGASWKPFQMNLPVVPITDLAIKNDNLIAATQGRSFWLIDDLTVLHQLSADLKDRKMHLYKPLDAYPLGGSSRSSRKAGTNLAGGVHLHFYLKEEPGKEDTLTLEILDSQGELIRSFSNHAEKRGERLKAVDSTNVFVWNMYYPEAEKFDGMVLWWGNTSGPKAVPGQYKARLILNGETVETDFNILPDPRNSASPEDLKAQFDFLLRIRDKLTEAHTAISDMRAIRKQINALTSRVDEEKFEAIIEEGEVIDSLMTEVEEALYQTKNRSNQDPLNFPIKLTNKLAHIASLASIGANRPTQQMEAFYLEVTAEIDAELAKWETLKKTRIPALNKLVHDLQVDVIALPEKQ